MLGFQKVLLTHSLTHSLTDIATYTDAIASENVTLFFLKASLTLNLNLTLKVINLMKTTFFQIFSYVYPKSLCKRKFSEDQNRPGLGLDLD